MSGLCECGCGQRTTLAPQSHTARGYVKGEPRRFIVGHTRPKMVVSTDELRQLYLEERLTFTEIGARFGVSRETAKKHLRAAGIPLRRYTPRQLPALLDRMHARIRKTPDGCWEWTGRPSDKGYGHFSVNGRSHYAHRVFYELTVGPIPEGLELDHICRNTLCVNPEHLEPVTHRENVLRGAGVAARNALKTHCKRGHAFTEDNILRVRSRPNARHCRTCNRERKRR